MGIVFDIVIIGIIALCTFIGYKQGLVKAIIKILSFFIAIIVAFALYKPVSSIIINNTSIDDNIKNTIIQKINPEGLDINQEVELGNNIELKILEGTNNTIAGISETFTIKLIETVTLLFIFIIMKIVLKVILLLTDLVTKIPLIKQANKLGGTIYGIVRGLILVYTILGVIYLAAPLMKNNISDKINGSVITKTLYNNNIVLNIII